MRHPEVPESLDGWHILHRMFGLDRRRFRALSEARRSEIAAEAEAFVRSLQMDERTDCSVAQILGHSADLMFTHYAQSFDDLGMVQMTFDDLELSDYLAPTSSYVSILELGLYEATGRIHADLRDRGLKSYSPEWNAAFDALLDEQAVHPRNAGRLFAKIPARRYVCFYPMNKRRGERTNWYRLSFAERARLMQEHGKIGRSFHGLVTQVISGSIGFDDWEWGVDLYADDPLVFKKLVYEMRFDEASAAYAEFGPFVTGMQFSIEELPVFLNAKRSPKLLNRATHEVQRTGA
ncbi:MAG TPA: hydrogen peroxide-dependent heme synthase [Candidatus Baltobacteraceae bacterium]|jgi:chlorite dismutase|nr:hydrogen peroxide-dependent heme synthase [Candidatus Baltobacteraceae bacterium]